MLKRHIAFLLLAVILVSLTACSSPNKYGLSYTSDGSSRVEYIFYNDERVVYVVGGLMTVKPDGEAKMLEMALDDGSVTIEDILAAAAEDAENGDVQLEEYPDGSKEYRYGDFCIVALNTHLGCRDVYFVPTSMGYYDVTN